MADENNEHDAPTLDFPADADASAAVIAETPEESPAEETPAEDTVVEMDAAPAAADEAAAQDAPDAEGSPAAEEAPVAEESPAAEEAPAAAEAPAADEAPAVEQAPAAAEPEASEPEEPAKPAPVTAVSLGLLPEVFVSQVSTRLHFYAPEIVPLPARPGRDRGFERDLDRDGDESSSGRRGRRRRGGSDEGDQRDEPRQPRQRVVEYITEPKAIKGSTRLEAKKQRRRDGRDAGRRRPVVTEAEFLARRESVDRKMVVRAKNGRTQIGVLEDGVLVEHYVARNQDASLIGNVYLGRVQNVLPSMEAAFVDIGRGRNAVLYSGEVDWDGVET
ncbi:MAG: ribonuclease E/G, partial [Microbacterium sp.]